MNQGKIIVFSAPSGSGKTTIIKAVRERIDNLHFSVSATSRAPRGTEQDGVDYFFLSPETFRQKIQEGAFIEYEEVYKDNFYGTLKSEVEKQMDEGHNVVLDIDVKGAVNVKRLYADRALLIFVQPPSIECLRSRLIGRGTDALEVIERRVAKAEYEMTFAPKFDRIVVNDIIEETVKDTIDILNDFLSQ